MQTYGGVEVYLHAFLTSALDGVSSWLHALAALLLRKEPRYPLDRRLAVLQSRWGEEKVLPCRASNSALLVRSLVTIATELFRLPSDLCKAVLIMDQ
jgi:hypothetical protein